MATATTTAGTTPASSLAGTSFAGSKLLSDGKKLSTALDNGDWVSGGMAAFDLIDDALDAAADPIGTLVGAGLGWLMEHMQPLKGWLEALAGDPGEVQKHAQSWATMAGKLAQSGSDLERLVSDVDTQAGAVVEAYREYQSNAAEHVKGAAQWAQGISSGMAGASKIVTIVHDLVKKAFSELVSAAIQWVAEAMATLGLGMPFVIAQVINKVRTLVNKVMGPLKKLLESIKTLQQLWGQLTGLFDQLKSVISGVVPGTAKVESPTLTTVTADQTVTKPDDYKVGSTTDFAAPTGLTAADRAKLDTIAAGLNGGIQKVDGEYRLSGATASVDALTGAGSGTAGAGAGGGSATATLDAKAQAELDEWRRNAQA
jgi:hypothetical protein